VFFVITMDAVVVNVALPAVRGELGGGISGLQWVVDDYTLMFAALLLSSRALSDRIGARRAFGAGLLVFVAASVACGLAPTINALVAARFVQGAAAAAMMPSSMALSCGADLGDQTPRGPPLDPGPVSGKLDPRPACSVLGTWARRSGVLPRARVAAGEHHLANRGRPRRGFGAPDFVGRSWPARCGESSNNAASGVRGAVDRDGGGGGRATWPSPGAPSRPRPGSRLLIALVSAGSTPREKQVVCFDQPGLTRRPRRVTVRAGAVKR